MTSSVWVESGKMASWLRVVLVCVGLVACAKTSPPSYAVHRAALSFDQAVDRCSPGVLASLATEHEVDGVLRRIAESSPPQSEFTFWVGLKKAKNRCVVSTLPLRGFQWTEDGSEDSQVCRWAKEPQPTCTAVLCAALQGLSDGSGVTRWGLISVTCRNVHPFICKLRDSESTSGITFTPDPPQPEPSKPDPSQPDPSKPDLPQPEPSKSATLEPELPDSRTELLAPDPGPTSGPGSPSVFGSDPKPGSGPGMWSEMCQNPLVDGARSLSPDPDNSSRMLVECWSKVQLELYCRGRPALWRLLDDAPADLAAICQPCPDGFHKDASGTCVDVDECSGAPCRHTCLNTEGSYRCVCADEDGRRHDEGSSACVDMVTTEEGGSLSGILIPVLAAVAVLLVLVVVAAVTVKCCLMRRAKKHDTETSEKMPMKNRDGQDSFATTNEKRDM
ncbi:hypothetical protein JOB18_018663 [Solea senegalensis]|nr:complement component C1q receptor-like [Solea senegalensis]XP_043874500.1 complement component C1q receptor-like [Solea senegalensis]KAG7453330.1 complement component C1q receptor-like [Solea senegalensis]KAG7453331.1 hypothetical protein JOB18_018663 [Solea senegalensis]